MKTKCLFLTAMTFLLLFVGCKNDEFNEQESETYLKSAHPHLKIALIGGLSYLDPSLMVDCLNPESDFMQVLSTENVTEELCKPIVDQALFQITDEKPDILLITGLLSYKGEKISHEVVAEILKNISKKGIKVFVIPGNVDINNSAAKAYQGNGSSPTPTVTEEEFEKLYEDFGFKDAISRDPNSMSYLTEAFNKLWILGIDARVYPVKSRGLIKPETMNWIKYWLDIANKRNITVLALCQNEVTEPWAEAAIWGPAYVIQDHENAENELTDAGLRIIFGAYANDITMYSKEGNALHNICAECLPSPPHSYRMITMDPNFMKIETRYITDIDATIPGGVSLLDYSNARYLERISNRLTPMFVKPPFNVPRGDVLTPGTADYYGLYFAKALLAFYTGDEQIPPEQEEVLREWPELTRHIIKNIYTDLPPEDVQLTIDLRKKPKER